MSGIVLSASVRQNLLSLQSTADLLAVTQNRLATGKKVNTALDNPTNFFTAASLDNRASDINNLLDGIGNGVQVLQAANTGISSLQKLVDSAKSVGNQVLQAVVGYSTKSTIATTAITGATATDLRGTVGAPTDAAAAPGTVVQNDDTGGAANITSATLLAGTAGAGSDNLASNFTATDTIVVNGTTINFNSGGGTTGTATGGDLDIDVTTGSVGDILAAIDAITGTAVPSTITGGQITLHTGTTADLVTSGTGLGKLGLTAGTTARTPGAAGPGVLNGLTLTIGATGGGTATSITFGNGTGGTVKSLNDLNAELASNNLQATISGTGVISITTTNDAASSTIGAIGGTATGSGAALQRPGRLGSGSGCRRRNWRAPIWCRSTTTSSIRSPRPRRTRPSTAST